MAGGPWGVARAGGRHLSWAARTEWGASIGTGPPRGPRGRKNQNTLPCYLFSTRGHRGSDVCARYPSRMNTNSRLLSAEPPCGLGTPVGLPTRSQECPRVSVQLRRGPWPTRSQIPQRESVRGGEPGTLGPRGCGRGGQARRGPPAGMHTFWAAGTPPSPSHPGSGWCFWRRLGVGGAIDILPATAARAWHVLSDGPQVSAFRKRLLQRDRWARPGDPSPRCRERLPLPKPPGLGPSSSGSPYPDPCPGEGPWEGQAGHRLGPSHSSGLHKVWGEASS